MILVGNQIELALDYIKVHYNSNEYDTTILTFEDEGFSGKNVDRPKFKEMLSLILDNKINVLICYRLDRISRNIADFASLINQLSEHSVDFISIKEQFDTRTPMGRAMMYIASVFAQLEREVIAERVRDNLLELAKTGSWLGGDSPLGYSSERFKKVDVCEKDEDNLLTQKSRTASKLIINVDELKMVRFIFEKYLELKSLSKLETYLMNKDIKTRKGKYYSIFSLKWILTNPVYAKNDEDAFEFFKSKDIDIYTENDGREKFDGNYGFLTYNKTSGKKDNPMEEWIIAVGLHPGIISGREWVAVQCLLEKNSDKSYRAIGYPKKQSIVSGLIKCKACGSSMRPKNMDKRREDGTVNYGYCCDLKEKSRGQKCNSKNVSGEKLDNKIIDIIKEVFVPNSEIYNELKKLTFSKDKNIITNEINLLEKERLKKQHEIDTIIDKLKYIDVDLIDTININLRKLKNEKAELENKIKKLQDSKINDSQNSIEKITAKNILNIIDNSFKIFDNYDLKTKRDITKLFIENIEGEGKQVTINFLNTKINETQKKLFVPSYAENSDFFLDQNQPSDSKSKITLEK